MYKTDSLEEPRIALLREHEVVHEYQLRDDLSAQTHIILKGKHEQQLTVKIAESRAFPRTIEACST